LDARWFDPEHDRQRLESALVGFLGQRPAVRQASGV
ncbi:MAG: tRNA (adenosine(37)-N6)-dimethylallyltransferase MiaA, partial [Xanthomonas perforans]|nr:tRNA (adenosine(37)-N6)-dimethylallyltransferase MiaA [Xanthomonas perforans]